MTAQPPTPKLEVRTLGLLGGITILAAVLRLYQASESLWLDELHTAWTVTADLSDIALRAADGNHPPTHFFLVWISTRILGMSEVAVRLPSLIAGTLIVPLLFVVVRTWTHSVAAAVLAALLATIDRDLLFYTQEARPYASVQLIGLVQILTFSRLIAPQQDLYKFLWRPTTRVIFVGTSVLLFYLHYTAGLLVVSEMAAYLVLVASRRWSPAYRLTHVAIDVSVIVAACLPALPHLCEIAARREIWRTIVEDWPTNGMLRFAEVYLELPLLLAALVWFIRWTRGWRPLLQPIDVRFVVLAGCWLAIPVAIAWGVTELDLAPLAKFRYVIVSSVAPIVLASIGAAACPGRTTTALFSSIVLLGALVHTDILHQFWKDGRLIGDRNEDWREVVQTINRSEPTSDWPVFLCAGLIEDIRLAGNHDAQFREYCLFPISGIYRVERTGRQLVPLPTGYFRPLTETQAQWIVDEGGAWLLVRAPDPVVQRTLSEMVRQLERQGISCQGRFEHRQSNVKLLKLVVAGEGAKAP